MNTSGSSGQGIYTIPISSQKKLKSLTVARAQTQGTTLTKSDELMVLMSGDVCFKFKFRLIGIERLNVLFEEMSDFVATENLDTKPRNVQLDNNEAVKKPSGEEGRLTKMANWFRNKFGKNQAEQDNYENTGGRRGALNKYLRLAIDKHENL